MSHFQCNRLSVLQFCNIFELKSLYLLMNFCLTLLFVSFQCDLFVCFYLVVVLNIRYHFIYTVQHYYIFFTDFSPAIFVVLKFKSIKIDSTRVKKRVVLPRNYIKKTFKYISLLPYATMCR